MDFGILRQNWCAKKEAGLERQSAGGAFHHVAGGGEGDNGPHVF